MKGLIFGLFIFGANSLSNRLEPKKLCRDCKYFIAHKSECALFGDTDLVNGSIDYEYASLARIYDKKCGEDAKYFEENTNKIVTIPYYFILNLASYWPVSPFFVLFVYVYTRRNPVN